jgi:hypothetical protein
MEYSPNTHPPTTIACPPDIELIMAETQPEEWQMCRLYVLIEPHPHLVVRYLGSTVQSLNSRYGQHKRKARKGHKASTMMTAIAPALRSRNGWGGRAFLSQAGARMPGMSES